MLTPLDRQVRSQMLQLHGRRLGDSEDAGDNIRRQHHQVYHTRNIGPIPPLLLCKVRDRHLPAIQLPIPAINLD